jgi:hypothetical protein
MSFLIAARGGSLASYGFKPMTTKIILVVKLNGFV